MRRSGEVVLSRHLLRRNAHANARRWSRVQGLARSSVPDARRMEARSALAVVGASRFWPVTVRKAVAGETGRWLVVARPPVKSRRLPLAGVVGGLA